MIIALFPSLFVLRYLLFYFIIKDALLRGSVGNLSRLDLSGNKIKSLEKLTQFVKASQALQVLSPLPIHESGRLLSKVFVMK